MIEYATQALGSSSMVTDATARYVIAGLRAVVEQGRSTPGDGFDFEARRDRHYREMNLRPFARAVAL